MEALAGLQDLMEDQKMKISFISDESCILDVTWIVVNCGKGHLLSG